MATGTRIPPQEGQRQAPPNGSPGRPAAPAGGGGGAGRTTAGAFSRSFPFLLITLGVAMLVMVAIFARVASRQDQATAKAAAVGYRTYGAGSGRVVNIDLTAVETTQQIAPDVAYHVWTFGGTAPGPVIRVTEGATVHFTLTNSSSIGMSHSIDFHAAQTPWDKNYQPVEPGQTATFDWVARFPGVFMYHCGVPPVLQHISNGMYGAIIVEPVTPLPKAREYVLVSSELYPADKPVKGVYEGDFTKMLSGNPQYVVFNGVADQYKDAPLVARPNERIRLWVMNAGPTLTNAFHVIGALFDHVYVDGNPTNVMNGVQTWNVAPGGGAMFELTIPDAGLYPFVTHSFAFTGRGAVGVLKVSTEVPAAPPTYPLMGDPFSAGVEPAAAQPQGPATGGSTGGSISGSTGGSTSGGTSGSGAANTFELMIQNVAFDDTDFTVKSDMKDMVALSIMNMDALAHDFTVDALNVKLVVGPDETKTFTFPAKPGIYDFYCSIPGHKEAGMAGTMTVVPGMPH